MNTLRTTAALLIAALVFFAPPAAAQPFTKINAGLDGVQSSSSDWGDYDADGDLDLVVTGKKANDERQPTIYRNDGNGTFTDIGAAIDGGFDGSSDWGDYDGDGDLDLVLTGTDTNLDGSASVYRNDGNGTFTDIDAGLVSVEGGSGDWGDYDGDGDLDLIITGENLDSQEEKAVIYRNDGGGTFIDIDAGLTDVSNSSSDWGDYDADGDLDLVVTGRNAANNVTLKIYRNDGGGTFTDVFANLDGVADGSSNWGDYDGDGDLDLVVTGTNQQGNADGWLYRNEGGGTFATVDASLTEAANSSSDWGDYDADGDLDLVIAGENEAGDATTTVYRNDGGSTFTDIGAGVAGVQHGSSNWGDYDGDGDLDLVLTGYDADFNETAAIYKNESTPGESQATIYVDASATGADDGSSWSDAYVHLQDAFDEVNADAATDYEIRVAEGAYVPDQDSDGDHTAGDESESFTLSRDDVTLKGGYPTGGGPRDPRAHPTVLSGDIDDNDTKNSDGVTENASDISGANSDHVLFLESGADVTSATVLDGVTVTAGQADAASSTDKAGGGIYNDSGFPTLVEVTLAGNRAETTGGGMFNEGQFGAANPTLVNATFTGNEADAGGGLYNGGNLGESSPALVNVVFTGNHATSSGGALYNSGVNSGVSSPVLVNVTFAENTADGGFVCGGGGMLNTASSSGTSEPEITNAVFWGNSSGSGGDQMCNIASGAQPTISHSLLEGGLSAISENDGSSTTDGGDNLDQDPQFADADGADDTAGTLDDDARLQGPGSGGGPSPAIDAGDDSALPPDTLDLDGDGNTSEPLPLDRAGNDRTFDVGSVSGSGVDMGAYESDGSPLPVELAGFEATATGASAVRLSWRTASETNNDRFQVERRRADVGATGRSPEWTKVTSVESKAPGGTSSNAIRYAFTDEALPFEAQRLTYRLRQVDRDGTRAVMGRTTVEIGAPQAFSLHAPFPNPVRSRSTVRYALPSERAVTLALYDALGRRVRTLVDERQRGRQEATFASEGLASGVYFVRMTAGDFAASRKVVLVR